MREEIAVATVSGKAYYLLVRELKERHLPFLSLRPQDTIPLDIKVIITTEKERHLVDHPSVLVFEVEADPSKVVNEALRIVQGKQKYEKMVIGIDPGETFGVAILSDGRVSETLNCPSLKETVNIVLKALRETPAILKVVKIGNGAPRYMKELLYTLDDVLPKETIIQVVREAGTSQLTREIKHRREMRNVVSAVKIAKREGKTFPRETKISYSNKA
ncbi:MAG: hypothetical protein QW231_03075 [Candidatus Bathyarchaeia archaeon]